jgi:hypothetical protein
MLQGGEALALSASLQHLFQLQQSKGQESSAGIMWPQHSHAKVGCRRKRDAAAISFLGHTTTLHSCTLVSDAAGVTRQKERHWSTTEALCKGAVLASPAAVTLACGVCHRGRGVSYKCRGVSCECRAIGSSTGPSISTEPATAKHSICDNRSIHDDVGSHSLVHCSKLCVSTNALCGMLSCFALKQPRGFHQARSLDGHCKTCPGPHSA